MKAYIRFEEALASGDLDTVRKMTTPERVQQLEAYIAEVGKEAFLEMVKQMAPDPAMRAQNLQGVFIRGEGATIVIKEEGGKLRPRCARRGKTDDGIAPCAPIGNLVRALRPEARLLQCAEAFDLARISANVSSLSVALRLWRFRGPAPISRADEGGGDAGLVYEPGGEELAEGEVVVAGEGFDALQHVEDLAAVLRLEEGVAVAHVAVGEGAVHGDLAREEALGDGAVGEDADVLLRAEGEKIRFRLALERVVSGLHAVDPPLRLAKADHVRIEVADTDGADLTGFLEAEQRIHGIVERPGAVGPVDLV